MLKFLKNILGNNKKENKDYEYIASPLEGKVVSITEVPDPVFSQKMMGDGFAVIPSKGIVVSPIDGVVASIFPTKHAIGLKGKNGREIIIHVGVETVNLNGEGFELFVNEGQVVKIGDRLLNIDIDRIKDKVPSVITPVIVSNLGDGETLIVEKMGNVALGEEGVAFIKINKN
ncbi:PTS sugar transporter subunit IIA [Fonticella tunisiensis]|uniref:PTS system IIA component (Glc family) n=1 Tax=Fonticella tunisiensis TaxID=1096341 RepID=A0A4R7KDC4_9CLOT|nr:PTS glucose transporter subunit IIA [Fonticella tunisiensis]TDT51965.1 PTS system IIA component (Glc family) [Fonticella tunisiensis]